MKLRIARLGVLLAALVGLMATMTPPASATYVKTVTFQGDAKLGSGLGYPGVGTAGPDATKIPCTDALTPLEGCVEVKSGPKGEPIVNVKPQGNHAGFSFNSSVCVKTSVSNDPAKKFPGPALCTIAAAGSVWGFCGLSTGIGVATLVNEGLGTGALKESTSVMIKFTGVGGVLHVTGGDATTNLHAEVAAVPAVSTETSGGVPSGPSCTRKTATTFTLTGEAVVKDITQ